MLSYRVCALFVPMGFLILSLFFFVIQVMENLQSLTNLQQLWLGRNRIKVVNLCGLNCIKKISLQSNRLTSMTGFEVCSLPMGLPSI